jgi:hypothetical protein
MRRNRRTRKADRNKTKLGLPDLEHVKSAVLVSLRSPESQRSYRRSIEASDQRMAGRGRDYTREDFPLRLSQRRRLGNGHYGKSGLARCEGICGETGYF